MPYHNGDPDLEAYQRGSWLGSTIKDLDRPEAMWIFHSSLTSGLLDNFTISLSPLTSG